MDIVVFNIKVTISSGQTLDLTSNGVYFGKISLNGSLINVNVLQMVDVLAGFSHVTISAGTQFTFDVTTQSGSISTGFVKLNALGTDLVGIVPHLFDNGVIGFAVTPNANLAKQIWKEVSLSFITNYAVLRYPDPNQGILLSGFSLDVTARTIDLFCPSKIHFLVEEMFGQQLSSNMIRFNQTLSLVYIRLQAGKAFMIRLQPQLNYLPIHPDVFTTRKSSIGGGTENSIQYQLALINGHVLIERNAQGLETLGWVANEHIDEVPAALLLKYTDANGHPIVAKPINKRIDLLPRKGVYSPVNGVTQGEIDQTIRGISLDTMSQCLLHSVHHSAIDWQKREDQLHLQGTNLKTSLQQPYWLKNPVVKTTNVSPSEIFGLTNGVRMTRQKDDSGLNYALNSTKIPSGADTIYHHLSLTMPLDHWHLESSYDEKETHDPKATTSPTTIGTRVVNTGTLPALAVPAYNYLFSIANMYDPQALNRTPTRGFFSSVIFNTVSDHIKTLNDALSGDPTAANPVGFAVSDKRHVSGFLRRYTGGSSTQPLQNFLLHPPMIAVKMVETVSIPPQIQSNTTNFQHGADSAAPVAAFVLASATGKLPEGLPLAGPLASWPMLTRLQRAWNLCSAYLATEADGLELKNLAKNILTLKQCLDNVQSNETNIRVGLFGQLYRLRLELLVTTSDAQKTFIQNLKRFLDGNPDELKGMSRNMATVQTVLNPLVARAQSGVPADLSAAFAAVQGFWNAGLPSKQDPTGVLNAFFDYFYKPCDSLLVRQISNMTQDKVDAPAWAARQALLQVFTGLDTQLGGTLQGEVSKVITSAAEGLNSYFGKLAGIWDDLVTKGGCANLTTGYLINRYGLHWDINLYKKIVAAGEAAVIDCLTDRLQQVVKDDLQALFSTIAQWDAGSSLFMTYEEQINNFLMIMDGWYKFYVANQAVLNKIIHYSNDQQGFVNAFVALTAPYQRQLYEQCQSYLNNELGASIPTWTQAVSIGVNQALSNMVKDNWPAIQAMLFLADNYNDLVAIATDYETQVKKAAFTIKVEFATFTTKAGLVSALQSYLLAKFTVAIDLVQLKMDPPQYFVYSKHIGFHGDAKTMWQIQQLLATLNLQKYSLSAFTDMNDDGSQKAWNTLLQDSSIFILKLGNQLGVAQLLQEVNDSNMSGGSGPLGSDDDVAALAALMDPDLLDPNWRGLLLIDPLADISQDLLVRDLVGKSSIKMAYLAVGGKAVQLPGANQPLHLDVYARVHEENAVANNISSNACDAFFTLVKFDATIKNTTLQAGEIVFYLDCQNIFGRDYSSDPKKLDYRITVLGTIPQKKPGDTTAGDFQFAAVLNQPLVFPLNFAFLDKLTLRGIKAERKNQRSILSIDGDLSFQNFGAILGNIGKALNLSNFRIILPGGSSNTRMGIPQYVNFDIGSIRFVIDKPRVINFYGLEISPIGIGFLKAPTGGPIPNFQAFKGSRLWLNGEPSSDNSLTYISLAVRFGNLPSLGGTGTNSFELDGVMAFSHSGSSVAGLSGPNFGIDSVSGQEVNIDLFRFISLHISKLEVTKATLTQGNVPVTAILANKIDLRILDWSPFGPDGLTLLFLHNGQGAEVLTQTQYADSGFLGYLNANKTIGPLTVYWVLLAHNLTFPDAILSSMLEPGMAGAGIQTMLKSIIDPKAPTDPAGHPLINNMAFTRDESWLFGAAFSLANILDNCSFILQDKHYYGINLASRQPWFKAIVGVDQFTLAYIPGATAEQDKFRVEFPLPALNFFGALKSGLVALEAGINRDFLFDFGFPWQMGNTYLWQRSFALPAGAYQINFGFYFQKTSLHVAGALDITISAGVGLAYGYHIGARTAIAWAEAGISVFMILTGAVTIELSASPGSPYLRLKEIKVTGVIGIYAYAEGGINLWVITAVLRARVIAAIAGTLDYVPAGHSTLTFTTTLSVEFEASCHISFGFFNMDFEVSGSLSYGVSACIALS